MVRVKGGLELSECGRGSYKGEYKETRTGARGRKSSVENAGPASAAGGPSALKDLADDAVEDVFVRRSRGGREEVGTEDAQVVGLGEAHLRKSAGRGEGGRGGEKEGQSAEERNGRRRGRRTSARRLPRVLSLCSTSRSSHLPPEPNMWGDAGVAPKEGGNAPGTERDDEGWGRSHAV